jgi:two-component sensor histidine kinase
VAPLRRKLLNLILVSTIPLLIAHTVAVVSLGSQMWRMTLDDVDTVTNLLHDFVDTTLEESIVSYLRSKVETARNLVDSTREADSAPLTASQLEELAETLLSLDVAQSGYVYVIDTNGHVVVHPDPTIEGSTIPNVEPVRTQLEKRDGYLEYSWQNSFEPTPQPKALFMVEYAPYDWIIAATAYRYEFTELIDRRRIADVLGSVSLNVEAYSTVVADDGTFIAHPDYAGRNLYEFFSKEEARRIMEMMFHRTEGRIRYSWPSREGERRRPKLMYFRRLEDFQWAVGTTVYLDSLRRPAVVTVAGFGAFGLLVVAVLVVLALRMSRAITDPITRLSGAAEEEARLDNQSLPRGASAEVTSLVRKFNAFVDRIEQQQREVQAREERLRRLLEDKNVLMRELHHRVKNNLQVIASLLSLQSQSVRDPDDAALFQRSSERVISMALVHEQLQEGNDVSVIPVREYLKDLIGHVQRAHADESIDVLVDCDDARLEISRAVPCGLIVNELVTNAMEHAFPNGQGGTVRVTFRAGGGRYDLEVSDTGIGKPRDIEGSLGTTLVSALASQLNASLEVVTHPGTTVTLSFAAAGG